MQVKYIGPHDGVYITLPPSWREVHIQRGETIEVSDPLGRSLLEQPTNWEQADPPPAKPAAKAEKKED